MKNKCTLIVIALLIIGCLGGCGKRSSQDQSNIHSSFSTSEQTNDDQPKDQSDAPHSETAQDGNPTDGDQLFAGCTLTGTVTEFSSTGCKITPTFQDGNVAYEAAPGYKDESELINIIYDEVCSFQISNINVLSGNVAYDSASIEDVKKQTRLIIYGEYDAENNLIADHIYIYRGTEE